MSYIKDVLQKLYTILGSRRLWVTVATIAVGLLTVYNELAVPFGADSVPIGDIEIVSGQILATVEAVRAIIGALLILIPSGLLVWSHTNRPPTRNDFL